MKVTQHGNKYRITYRVPGYDKVFKETFDTIEEANIRLAELEFDKKKGELKPPIALVKNRDKRNTLFSDFLDIYIRDYGLSKWKDSYLTITRHRIEHYIKPFIGHLRIYLRFPELKKVCNTCLVLTDVKTDSSVRQVYVPPTVAKALLAHKDRQNRQIESCHGLYNNFDLVIAQNNGRPIETRLIDVKLKEFIKQNGFDSVVFHSFRALSTTDKLQLSGGDIKAVQGDTGHASPKMVTEQYSRIRDNDRKRLAGLMEEAYFGKTHSPATTPDEDAALQLLRANPNVLSLLLAMNK